jgi:hypothetical protein
MQYPNIAQPQYGFAPTMPMMPSMSDMPPGMMGQNMPQMNFKEGGIASLSLPEMAERVQDAGRGGDTMLAHITPEEAGILKLLGGSGTINPKTGQPEFIRKFLKRTPIVKEVYKGVSSIGKEIERGVESIAKDKILGPIAQMASYLHPVSAFLYAGLAPEGSSFDTKRAAKAAAMQQIGEYAVKQMQAQGAPGMDGSAAGTGGTGGLEFDYSYDGTNVMAGDAIPTDIPTEVYPVDMASRSVTETILPPGAAAPPPPPPPPLSPAPVASPSGIESLRIDEMAAQGVGDGATNINPALGGPPAEIATASSLPPSSYQGMTPDQMTTARAAESTASGISGLAGTVGDIALSYGDDALNYALNNKVNTAFIANQIYAGMEAKKELDEQKEEAERVLAAQEKHTQEEIAFAQDVLRRYPVEYRRLTAEDIKSQNFAGGGLAGLNAFKAGGGPRFLKGGGDGMSDDIPAMIGKQQKAALSDGEFVVPADVVSHLGNGSSRAGAKKLYSMMDNIRQARTGKKRQAPEVKSDRYMPA